MGICPTQAGRSKHMLFPRLGRVAAVSQFLAVFSSNLRSVKDEDWSMLLSWHQHPLAFKFKPVFVNYGDVRKPQ